jgi:CheY-like chemotaxis protein
MLYKNIIHIDDDEDDQELFTMALDQLSTEVSCMSFTDARSALKNLIEGIISPEAIFLDLNMPVMDGEDFLVKIKEIDNLRQIPVIILTTSGQQATITRMSELGAAAYLTKPNSLQELTSLLENL